MTNSCDICGVPFPDDYVEFQEAMRMEATRCQRCQAAKPLADFIVEFDWQFPGFDTSHPRGQYEAAGWVIDLLEEFTRHVQMDVDAIDRAAARAKSMAAHPASQEPVSEEVLVRLQEILDSVKWPEGVVLVRAQLTPYTENDMGLGTFIDVLVFTEGELSDEGVEQISNIISEHVSDEGGYRVNFVRTLSPEEVRSMELGEREPGETDINIIVRGEDGQRDVIKGKGPSTLYVVDEPDTTNGEQDDELDR